jgi:protein tyrosine/serine phosphatase
MDSSLAIEFSRHPVFDPLPPDVVAQALSAPPFIKLEGSVNLRDLGGSSLTSSYIKPGKIFRSGAPAITPDNAQKLRLVKVFDLRSDKERKRDAVPWTSQGCEVVWTPAELDPNTSTAELGDPGEDGYMVKTYLSILHTHRAAYAALFRGIVALRPEEAILFHCTAGKDRTGIAAALILSLLGVPKDAIGTEYSLTRVGIEPARGMLLEALKRGTFGVSMDDSRLVALSECKPETMVEFLNRVEEKWGKVEGCVHEVLGLSAEEISQVKENLRT